MAKFKADIRQEIWALQGILKLRGRKANYTLFWTDFQEIRENAQIVMNMITIVLGNCKRQFIHNIRK